MYTHAPSASTTRIKSDPNILVTTRQRIQKQLAAVIRLCEHNFSYLEPSERSWIEHVISEALTVSGDPQSSANSFLPHFAKTVPAANGLREKMSVCGLTPKSWTAAHVAADDDMSVLLGTSRALNSVNSLLSCCYDRWSWLQSSQVKEVDSRTNDEDLQELLGRRKQRQRRQSSRLSPGPGFSQLPQRNNTTSSGSSRVATTSNDGSENSLSLVVDGTIERWRQNAEDALNETTARLEASGISHHQSPKYQYPLHTFASLQCSKEHENPFFGAENDATAVRTRTTSRTFTQHMSTSSSQPSVWHSDLTHTGTTGAAGSPRESYSQDETSSSKQLEGYHSIRPAFKSTLHNSFDKEAVNNADQGTENSTSNPPPTTTQILSSSFLHPSSAAKFHKPHITQTTQVSLNLPPRSGGLNRSTMYTLPTTFSTSSVQSKISEESQIPRSRGRRWLEQQSSVAQNSS